MDDREEQLELFRIMVESAANNENKRVLTNSFYTVLIVGLLSTSEMNGFNPIIFSTISLVFSLIWILNIKSYRALAKAKFHVICTMEKNMLCPIFANEWEEFKKKKVFELTYIEMAIPCSTGIISLILLVVKLLEFID